MELDDTRITVRDDRGESRSVAKSALSGVAIETNDSGPWGADLWWLFFEEDRLACAFPQGATGEQAAIDHVLALPGVDHGELAKAMASITNAAFVLWRRDA